MMIPIIMTIGQLPTSVLQKQSLVSDCEWLSLEQFEKGAEKSANVAVILIGNNTKPEVITALIAGLLQFQGIILSNRNDIEADVVIPALWPINPTVKAINLALKYWHSLIHQQFLQSELDSRKSEKRNLSKIGIALSAEKDLGCLLEMVLTYGRKLSACEGASLFLVDKSDKKNPMLCFRLAQNETVELNFEEKSFPLSKQSLAGYVALTGEVLNIKDAYEIDPTAPYHFDSSFDKAADYRTRELLVLPMQNHEGEIIGILQFLNRKDELQVNNRRRFVAFGEEMTETLMALASQAAVAIDNSLLLENIHNLFEGFVSASVKAIESRDPVTSGHSFRVAELTIGLAEILPRSGDHQYKNKQFSSDEIRELRYAALLHDFGKVGVREHVLLKAKKLDDTRLEILKFRIMWLKERLQKDFYQKICEYQSISDRNIFVQQQQHLQEVLNKELEKLEHFHQVIEESNQPSILDEDTHEHLEHLSCYQVKDAPWTGDSLISNDDFLALSVKRGSLTEEERFEIQSHVSNTLDYLLQIPWTTELKNIPHIASAHHEKINGKGYPRGLKGSEIPVQSRIMTVADIYDALTARDRPYKSSLPNQTALDILHKEAKQGLLDQDLVNIFTDAKIYQIVH